MGARFLKRSMLGVTSLSTMAAPAVAQTFDPVNAPAAAVAFGAVSLAVAAALWAVRVSANERSSARQWSGRLARIEAQLEKSESVLSAHPGLLLIWDEDEDTARAGWGRPRVLGGPAALASTLSFIGGAPAEGGEKRDAVTQLLDALGGLQIEGEEADSPALRDRIHALRVEGEPFSATVVTSEGRKIEADGRIAGSQVCLWLADPSARAADESGALGKLQERSTDLHASLSMLERAPFPAWRRGADLKLQWVNAAYAEAVEAASPQEAVERGIELDGALKAVAQNAAESRQPTERRCRAVVKGARRILRIIETPLHGAGGAALGGAAFDETATAEAEDTLKRHIEAHNETLNHVDSAVAIFGSGAELIYYNTAFARMWNLQEAWLDTRPAHGELLDKMRDAGLLPEHADYPAWKGDQLSLYTDVDGENAGDPETGGAPDEVWDLPDGRAVRFTRQRHPFGGLLNIFDDITDELRLQARYNTLIGVQRATLNNLAEGVAVFGADGALHLFNSAFQRLWGLQVDLLGARPHFEKIVREVDGLVEDGAQHWVRIGERITSLSADHRKPLPDAELTRVDGKTYLYATEPLPDGATLLRFLDVTDSKAREQALEERNEALMAADNMKSSFVNHVSYQLRTPLNTIIGFSELLESEMFGGLNDRQREYAVGVLTASHQLLDLINDIIDLATIEAGKMALERHEIDVRRLLENAINLASLKAEDTRITLSLDCPATIGAISADERRLKQVLFNLISNAFAFTPPGGAVTIGARREGENIRLWVSDTGRGIEPADQARAFDRFESKGQNSGAGLGLALVRSFIELHGGWVALKSTPQSGSTVICHLPSQATEDAGADDVPQSLNASSAAE